MANPTHAPRPQTRGPGMQEFFDDLTKSLIDNFKRIAPYPLAMELQRSCMSCKNFVEPTELCVLYNKRPPARVIAYSCTDYIDKVTPPENSSASRYGIDDDIPF